MRRTSATRSPSTRRMCKSTTSAPSRPTKMLMETERGHKARGGGIADVAVTSATDARVMEVSTEKVKRGQEVAEAAGTAPQEKASSKTRPLLVRAVTRPAQTDPEGAATGTEEVAPRETAEDPGPPVKASGKNARLLRAMANATKVAKPAVINEKEVKAELDTRANLVEIEEAAEAKAAEAVEEVAGETVIALIALIALTGTTTRKNALAEKVATDAVVKATVETEVVTVAIVLQEEIEMTKEKEETDEKEKEETDEAVEVVTEATVAEEAIAEKEAKEVVTEATVVAIGKAATTMPLPKSE
jgi:hypothetical protein